MMLLMNIVGEKRSRPLCSKSEIYQELDYHK